jgi:multidrug resistance efflux pump
MKGNRKKLLITVFILMILAIGGVGAYYWYNNTYYVSTDDSMIQADLVNANTQISGKLLELNVHEGQYVQKGEIIARQDMGSLPDTSLDSSLVRAPISGIVIKKQGILGEITPAGETIATIVDPSKLYITANIEETRLANVKPGELVDFTVDEYGGKKFTGRVDKIGGATEATFSLLPTSSGGTFTKVTQKIPVKIKLDKYNVKLEPGLNVVVNIHIK